MHFTLSRKPCRSPSDLQGTSAFLFRCKKYGTCGHDTHCSGISAIGANAIFTFIALFADPHT